MNTHQIFRRLILPKLLATAKRSHVLDSLVSISLYGSANYGYYDEKTSQKEFNSEKSDYDIWIVFERNYLAAAKTFATELFEVSFYLVPNQQVCILYDKTRLQTKDRSLLIAPIIITEDCYEILQENSPGVGDNVLIPWHRPRARERPPRVPICSTDLIWSEFDMLQTYLSETNLWRLMMPAIVYREGVVTLGTFIESVLSGDCFYGDFQRDDQLKKSLFLGTLARLRLEEVSEIENVPLKLYQMMTLATKAGSHFRERKLRQFSQWLSK